MNPGALIITSSGEAKRTLPLHGAYGASKKAVEGYIEAARVELMKENSPLSITRFEFCTHFLHWAHYDFLSIVPGTINTPFFDQARVKCGDKKLIGPPPLYHPDVVACSIEYAATHPVK